MNDTKLRLDEIGQLNDQLTAVEETISKVAYVKQVINSISGIVFDSTKPTAIELPTEVINKIADIVESHLTKERDAVLAKASVLIK